MRVTVMKRSVLGLLIYLNCNGLAAAVAPCKARWGDTGYICVCDSSYCDTIERPAQLPAGQFHWYSTSNSTPGFSHTVGNFSRDPVSSNDDVVFKINSSVKFQEMIGFGGSFTDSSGFVLNSLPEEAQEKLIESYFGTTGIEYSVGRFPIGGSDFSLRVYSLDDVPNDENLQYFNLTEEDFNFKIPLIKKARNISQRGVKLLACPWLAPQWMKHTNDNAGGYLRSKYMQLWARYQIKFLEAYKQSDIDIWALSGGNEVVLLLFLPVLQGPLNSTIMTADIQREWFKDHLYPLVKASDFSHVKVIALEDQRLFVPYWMERFAVDTDSFDGFALHWYFDFFIPPNIVTNLHKAFPDKLILCTETSINGGFGPKPVDLGSWYRAEAYMHNIIENINHWAQAYIDWNLALDPEGGPHLSLAVDAAVIVNKTSGQFYKQPIFYGLGHFSKFIPPGSFRVQMESNQNNSNPRNILSSHNEDVIKEFLYSRYQNTPPNSSRPPPFPIPIPSVVESVATANPDGSYTVIVFNAKNVTSHVRIEDTRVGSISVDIEEHSINSFVYWA